MNGSPLDPSESARAPLGPAISPRVSPRSSPLGEMEVLLAPFGTRPDPHLRPAAAEPARHFDPPTLLDETDGILSGSDAADDLPWLTLGEPLDEPTVRAADGPVNRPEAERASGVEPVPAPELVAARLEDLARTLRERGPAALLQEPEPDSLALLVAGYALGYAAAGNHGRATER